ncbi:hypothetical protein [Candidatus Parabeggiatoa sp. HSG14]|uniref:hypothetical protein n=1 Tax=Candidatus Parabeggiatoa sp. HSG14 TaxID=3055593 RepID=UPI0025A6AA95|nr:hypothetical protein [Thiotrichales bacterium HSG14]
MEIQAKENIVIDEDIFRECMQQLEIASEFFFPLEHAAWYQGYFSLKKDDIAEVRTKLSGVRFQVADLRHGNIEPEHQCQQDVVNLIQSLIRLREIPELANVVLSGEILTISQPLRSGTCVKFGLYLDPNGRFNDETAAARVCHRSIIRAVQKSGFTIASPKTFDSETGMNGLSEWGSQLQLRRRHKSWLFLLLLLLPFWFLNGNPPKIFVPIETQSVVILVEKSAAMIPHFSTVQAEAKNALQQMMSSPFSKYYVDVIAYHTTATSALGSIKKVNNKTGEQLIQFLNRLEAEENINLQTGIALAAQEVAAHQKPTTLLILTNGQDINIVKMLQNMKPILNQFQGVKITGNILTPKPSIGEELKRFIKTKQKLIALATALNGQLGTLSGVTNSVQYRKILPVMGGKM